MDIRFLDRVLVCESCGAEFVWTAGEQEFYAVMGFGSGPKRCPACRKDRLRGGRRGLIQHEVICSACGKKTLVPFIPKEGRPVYCRECYQARNKPDEVA